MYTHNRISLPVLFLLLALTLGSTVGQAAVSPKELKENKAIAATVVEKAWNEGKFKSLKKNYSDKARDGLKKQIKVWREALPDMKVSIKSQIAQGDSVATHWLLEGTHNGQALFGMEPNGQKLELYGTTINQFANGQVVKEWNSLSSFQILLTFGKGQGGKTVSTAASAAPVTQKNAMSDADFAEIMTELKSKSFRQDILGLMKIIAKYNYFNAAQITAMLNESKLHMSSAKKEAFQLLYPKLLDKAKVNAIFADVKFFPSDQRELNKWVVDYGNPPGK